MSPVVLCTIDRTFQPFEKHPVFTQLSAMAHKKQLVLELGGPFGLGSFIFRMRAELEHLSHEEQYLATLMTYYGTKLFQCMCSHCMNFHRGFSSSAARNQYLSQHECPFKCSLAGCPRSNLGFPSKRELNSHLSIHTPNKSISLVLSTSLMHRCYRLHSRASRISKTYECNFCCWSSRTRIDERRPNRPGRHWICAGASLGAESMSEALSRRPCCHLVHPYVQPILGS